MTTEADARPNPHRSQLALRNRSAAIHANGHLVRLDGSVPTPVQELAHDALRGLVLSPRFSCVGAASAFRRGSYEMAMYDRLGSEAGAAGLAHDLYSFLQRQHGQRDDLATFVACFCGPTVLVEQAFENLLWQQLQLLHERDDAGWDPSVSADPNDPSFSFSFGGKAFYVIGLHPAAARWARRFGWPTMVFNLHDQFERLRLGGRFERMRETIREREMALQGSTLPTLADFGEASEARQYAGREVEPDWRCPFRPHER